MNTLELEVRIARAEDLEFVGQDGYLNPQILRRKVSEGDVVIALIGPVRVGYVRLEYLWSRVPYIALIRVLEQHRRRGIGRAMVTYLEDHLRSEGHTSLYSSSQADEAEPQAWHRRVGFEECGIISGINAGGVGEIFFRRHLIAQNPSETIVDDELSLP